MSAVLTLDLRSYQAETHRHRHDYHQLVLPLAGCLEMEVERRDGEVTARQAAIIPAGAEHGFAARGDNCFMVADLPAALAPELTRLPAFVELDTGLNHYLQFLGHECRRGSALDGAGPARSMLLLLVQLLAERFGEALPVDQRLARARDYLEQNLDRPLRIAELAQVAHLSVRQLNALFRRQFDCTPQQYLLAVRMQRARELLSAGGLSVQQVAERCGYANLSAFSNRFSRHFGCSPRQLRARQLG
ncbi:AraC family transcriptional regulator [Marinobacterium arenosum]|uniref:AraC family transcriptional regulator n=1 Tax=Marinobacterium arenosum TaxID=2862496 RepID=UPI001C946DC9|nr:AraC family transcriptional regulator [Marinobacterium arenosum]MBY4675844.1 AraC family transcriptional regulator [Marinobacterium arenosum]